MATAGNCSTGSRGSWGWVAGSAEPARLLVVEDNATTARTLRLFLEAQGYHVVCAASGSAALDRVASEVFDLVLLDLMLPDVEGLAVCRTIRRTSQVPIVMLTARVAEDDVVAGLEAGADDYVCKPFGSKTLLARIRTCLRRVSGSDSVSRVLSWGGLRLEPDSHEVTLDGQPVRLTRTEFAILHQLMRRPGRVFTRAHLIDSAIGPDYDGVERTIDTHVWSLRKKLGDRSVITAEPGIGYRLNAGEAN
jgi:DNA-binding response OmpR family regulator